MFICRVASDSAAVIPGWMFDLSRCAGMVLGAPRPSLAALEEMRALLHELGFDDPTTAIHERSQEAADEAETIVATGPSPDDAAVAAPAGGARGDARSGGASRVIAALARLLLEAVRPADPREGADDAP